MTKRVGDAIEFVRRLYDTAAAVLGKRPRLSSADAAGENVLALLPLDMVTEVGKRLTAPALARFTSQHPDAVRRADGAHGSVTQALWRMLLERDFRSSMPGAPADLYHVAANTLALHAEKKAALAARDAAGSRFMMRAYSACATFAKLAAVFAYDQMWGLPELVLIPRLRRPLANWTTVADWKDDAETRTLLRHSNRNFAVLMEYTPDMEIAPFLGGAPGRAIVHMVTIPGAIPEVVAAKLLAHSAEIAADVAHFSPSSFMRGSLEGGCVRLRLGPPLLRVHDEINGWPFDVLGLWDDARRLYVFRDARARHIFSAELALLAGPADGSAGSEYRLAYFVSLVDGHLDNFVNVATGPRWDDVAREPWSSLHVEAELVRRPPRVAPALPWTLATLTAQIDTEWQNYQPWYAPESTRIVALCRTAKAYRRADELPPRGTAASADEFALRCRDEVIALWEVDGLGDSVLPEWMRFGRLGLLLQFGMARQAADVAALIPPDAPQRRPADYEAHVRRLLVRVYPDQTEEEMGETVARVMRRLASDGLPAPYRPELYTADFDMFEMLVGDAPYASPADTRDPFALDPLRAAIVNGDGRLVMVYPAWRAKLAAGLQFAACAHVDLARPLATVHSVRVSAARHVYLCHRCQCDDCDEGEGAEDTI